MSRNSGPAEAVKAWVVAVAAGDGEGACELMTEHARRQLLDRHGSEDCTEAIGRIGRALGEDARAELGALAVAEVRHPAPDRAVAVLGELELGLERRDGRWVVGDLMTAVRGGGGGAYPPPTFR
jgi:DNA-binding transcriptional ArsR family regulator